MDSGSARRSRDGGKKQYDFDNVKTRDHHNCSEALEYRLDDELASYDHTPVQDVGGALQVLGRKLTTEVRHIEGRSLGREPATTEEKCCPRNGLTDPSGNTMQVFRSHVKVIALW